MILEFADCQLKLAERQHKLKAAAWESEYWRQRNLDESLTRRGCSPTPFVPATVETVPVPDVESLLAMRPDQIFVTQQEDNDVYPPDDDVVDNEVWDYDRVVNVNFELIFHSFESIWAPGK